MTPSRGVLHVGTVTEFDEARGLGTVAEDADDAGDARVTWPFHCTALTDGSRTVEVGARVAFSLVAGHLGRMEAAGVTKLDGG